MTKKAKYICRRTVRKRYELTNNQILIACDDDLISFEYYPFRKAPYNIKFSVEDIEKHLDKIRKFPRDADSEEMRKFNRKHIKKYLAERI